MGKKHRNNQWDSEEEPFRGQEAGQEELNEYIRVASPGTFIVILSLLILAAAMIIWGFTGTLPVTETVTGLVIDTAQYSQLNSGKPDIIPDGEDAFLILCFVDASRYNGQAIKEFGDQVSFKMPDQTTFTGTIETRSQAPVSKVRAKGILFDNEWVLEKCANQDYNWLLVIRPDDDISRYTFTLADVTLLTDEVAPIQFLMR